MASGIYVIIAKLHPDKIYIGSANYLEARKKRHFSSLKAGTHFNSKLQNYYNKYGSFCFDFYVIEHISPRSLLDREQFYIETRKPFFNINPIAASRLGAKHTKLTKNRIKKSCRTRHKRSMFSYIRQFVVKLTS